MDHKKHLDATVALTLIFLLMITLLGLNTFYYQHALSTGHEIYGAFPVSKYIAPWFASMTDHQLYVYHEVNWWAHILIIFFFANYLPYSKHFHVFLSVPNVFLSRLEPLGKLDTMENVKKEVQMMMDPNASLEEQTDEEEVDRFGVMDVEDVSWKNYFDSLACTQCGRCTDVCPANITGKRLSPRKIIMDVRERMKEKGPGMVKNGKEYSDNKSLLRDYITEEELWACTTCNACAQECPININHPTLIVEMRRYLVMEEASGPGDLNAIFSNIENNGAPWQYSQEDRMNWAEELYVNEK
jgi:heterodisulfide reductase subunit C